MNPEEIRKSNKISRLRKLVKNVRMIHIGNSVTAKIPQKHKNGPKNLNGFDPIHEILITTNTSGEQQACFFLFLLLVNFFISPETKELSPENDKLKKLKCQWA